MSTIKGGYFQTDRGPIQLLEKQRRGEHPSNPNAVKGGWYKAKEMEGRQSYLYIHESDLTDDKRIEPKPEWAPKWMQNYNKRIAGEIKGGGDDE